MAETKPLPGAVLNKLRPLQPGESWSWHPSGRGVVINRPQQPPVWAFVTNGELVVLPVIPESVPFASTADAAAYALDLQAVGCACSRIVDGQRVHVPLSDPAIKQILLEDKIRREAKGNG